MLADDLERLMSFGLPAIWLLLFWVERPTVAVDVVKDGVLDASEVEPTVQHCPTVILVSLPETWVLMQLCQNFVQARHWCALMTHLFSFHASPCVSLFQILIEQIPVTRMSSKYTWMMLH